MKINIDQLGGIAFGAVFAGLAMSVFQYYHNPAYRSTGLIGGSILLLLAIPFVFKWIKNL